MIFFSLRNIYTMIIFAVASITFVLRTVLKDRKEYFEYWKSRNDVSNYYGKNYGKK